MYWLLGLGIGGGVAYYLKKLYDKQHETWYEKGHKEGIIAGEKMEKARKEKHYKHFIFDEKGLDTSSIPQWHAKLLEVLNPLCKNEKEAREYLLQIDMLYNIDISYNMAISILLPQIPRPVYNSNTDHPFLEYEYLLSRAFYGDDTEFLVAQDMAYRILRDSYLLDVDSNIAGQTKAQMDHWYLTQRERYLRMCLVKEELFSCDLDSLWFYEVCLKAKKEAQQYKQDSNIEAYLESVFALLQSQRQNSKAYSFWQGEPNNKERKTQKGDSHTEPKGLKLWLTNWVAIFYAIWQGERIQEVCNKWIEKCEENKTMRKHLRTIWTCWEYNNGGTSKEKDDEKKNYKKEGYEKLEFLDERARKWFQSYLKTQGLCDEDSINPA